MKTKYWIEFTKSEIEHIDHLFEKNEENGEYTSPKQAYWNRSFNIRKKLGNVLKICHKKQ